MPEPDQHPVPQADGSTAPPVAIPKTCPIPFPGTGNGAASSGAAPEPGQPGSSDDPGPVSAESQTTRPKARQPDPAPRAAPEVVGDDSDDDSLWESSWYGQLDPGHLGPNQYSWIDVRPHLPPLLRNPPWSSREGWCIDVQIPTTPGTIHRPGWWPFPDLFCLSPGEHPRWLERLEPAAPLSHLRLRGYCTHSCSRLLSRTQGNRCLGLCLRPIMAGERSGQCTTVLGPLPAFRKVPALVCPRRSPFCFLMLSACPLLNLARQQTPTAPRFRQKTALLPCRRSFSVSVVHVSFTLLCCRTWWRSWRPWRRAGPSARLRSALILLRLAHPIFRVCLRLCPLLWPTPSRSLWTWKTRRRRLTHSPVWQRPRTWHPSPLRLRARLRAVGGCTLTWPFPWRIFSFLVYGAPPSFFRVRARTILCPPLALAPGIHFFCLPPSRLCPPGGLPGCLSPPSPFFISSGSARGHAGTGSPCFQEV